MAYGPQQQDAISHWQNVEKMRGAVAKAKNPKVKVNQRHLDAVARRDAKLHTNAMTRYGAAHQAPGGGAGGTAPPTADPSTAALLEAATRLRYGGQEQALGQQLNQNARFTSGVPTWYQNALAEIKGLQTQGQQQSAQTLGQIQNYNSPATLPNNPVDQQAAQARNNLNSEYGAMFGRDAASNSALMDRIAAAMVTQQGNTLSQANVQRQGLLGEQTALQGQKGDFKTTYGAQLNAGQAKSDIEMKKIQAGIYIAQGKNDMAQKVLDSLNADRTQKQKVARSGVRVKKQNAQTNAAKQALGVAKEARQAYLDAHPELKKGKKGAGGRTAGETTAHHKIIRTVDNAVDDVTRGRDNKLSDKAIRGAMQMNKIPNDVIDAAFARADGKPLSATQINRLRNAGLIAPPRKWKQGTQSLGQIVVKGIQGLTK